MDAKERFQMLMKICERAEEFGYDGDRQTLMMDLQSADKKFNLRLEEMLNGDDYNFVHDINGIINNIVRDKYPSDDFGFFVPRYAGKEE